ncbi:MAG: DUF3842 family protein [Clostridia bacterium]|nr:DUF3842 family protein [Clostridia bacterium]MBR7083378.1 DUF3842 family protein [Clostridia bacterium]
MKILVIDGQGGNIGRQLVKMISEAFPDCDIHAVGTNSIATANMLKGANVSAATGENAVVVGCRKADIIVGPIGVVVADSLGGEVTPKMAVAVGQSDAVRVLVPMNKCRNIVAGVREVSTSTLLDDVIKKIGDVIKENS